jgi:hypothetical protein
LIDLIFLPEAPVLSRYPIVPISPSFSIPNPRSEATITINQNQGSMLEWNSTSFKVDHLIGVDITYWSNKSETKLIINGNGEIGSKFLKKEPNESR